jgi:sterol desaturase/sphingolipid hydroxylase (fatty acid hydroxylase superfamily)
MFQKSLLGLLVLGVIFFFIEKIVGLARRQFWQRTGWLTDMAFFFLAPGVKFLGKFLVVVPGLILIVTGLIERGAFGSGDYHGYGPVSRQPLWCQFIEIYVLADFIGYWMHRWFHAPTLWPFHAVHHSSEELDWLASVRVHPVNEWANALVHVTPLLLLGFNPHAALSVAPFLTFYAIFLHAQVNWDFGPLRGWVASPVFHRWHHSKSPEAIDKNFAGLLPVWDILFGTYYMPTDRWPEDFGIQDAMPKSFWGQIWAPFAWKRTQAVAKSAAETP